MCDITYYFSLPPSKIKQQNQNDQRLTSLNPQLQEIINYDELQVYHRPFCIRPHSFLWPQAVRQLVIFDMISLFKDDFKSRFSHVTKTWPICIFQPDNHRKVHVNLTEAQSMDILLGNKEALFSLRLPGIRTITCWELLSFLMWKKVPQRIKPAQGKAKMRDGKRCRGREGGGDRETDSTDYIGLCCEEKRTFPGLSH